MTPTPRASVPKDRTFQRRFLLFSAAWLIVGVVAHAGEFSLATEFVYRGGLQQQGAPAEGVFDFSFELYDRARNGQLLGTIDRFDLTVEHGVFAVPLDFGPEAVSDQPRWLEVRVRSAGKGPYESLLPRQSVAPSGSATCVVDRDVEVQGRLALTARGGGVPPDVDQGGQLAILGQLGGVRFDENEIQTFSTLGNPRDLILNADGGYVGIGVDHPQAALHVASGPSLGILVESETGGRLIVSPDSITSLAPELLLAFDVSVYSNLRVGQGLTVVRDLTVGRDLTVEGTIDLGYEYWNIDWPGDSGTVYCSEGKRVVSGGCSNSHPGVLLETSRPLFGPDGWTCSFDNDNFVTSVSLICADIG